MDIDVTDALKNGSYSDFHEIVKNELNDRYEDNSHIKDFTNSISRLKNLQSALEDLMYNRTPNSLEPDSEPDSTPDSTPEIDSDTETEENE